MLTRSARRTRAEAEVDVDTGVVAVDHEVEQPKLPKVARRAANAAEAASEAAIEDVIVVDDIEHTHDEFDAKDDDDDEEENEAEDNGRAADMDATVDEWEIEQMDLKTIKEILREKDLSIKGNQKVLAKRLIGRLHKEKDPDYKPRPKGRVCKWCGAFMKKRRSLKGPFFGCETWPACQYTTSLSGYAKPSREHLKGKPGVMQYRDSSWYERYY
jgi:hypothetical protein